MHRKPVQYDKTRVITIVDGMIRGENEKQQQQTRNSNRVRQGQKDKSRRIFEPYRTVITEDM